MAGDGIRRIEMRLCEHAGRAQTRERGEGKRELVGSEVFACEMAAVAGSEEGAKTSRTTKPKSHVVLDGEQVADGASVGASRRRFQHVTPVFRMICRQQHPSIIC